MAMRDNEARRQKRLVDYVCLVGIDHLACNEDDVEDDCNERAQQPQLLRRFPAQNHPDFPLPNNIANFCQPDGCTVITGNGADELEEERESTTFVFTLTDKDSNVTRYAVCHNFYREYAKSASDLQQDAQGNHYNDYSLMSDNGLSPEREPEGEEPWNFNQQSRRQISLVSICIVSHFEFFSNFKECALALRQLIDTCDRCDRSQKSLRQRSSSGRRPYRHHYDAWQLLVNTGNTLEPPVSSRGLRSFLRHISDIENWIDRLLDAPYPKENEARVELELFSQNNLVLTFALPDKDRLSLCDFPLHLPLELLGVSRCLQVLSLILLERKIVVQSHDYSALSFSILSLTRLIYPLDYVFPIIPLLPPVMNGAETLLLVPTPYIIGIPSTFFATKRNVQLPDDVWLVDLDRPFVQAPVGDPFLPLPESDGKILKSHLKQVLNSISIEPIHNFEEMSSDALSKLALRQQLDLESPTRPSCSVQGPFLFGNDTDSVDVATRVAMTKFFSSDNLFGNFENHTRTLRLYPRPIVTIQAQQLLNSRTKVTPFMSALVQTQAVECFAEWSLTPDNLAFRRIQEGVCDPVIIGDKPRWFAHHLQVKEHKLSPETETKLYRMLNKIKTKNEAEHASEPDESSLSFSSEEEPESEEDEGIFAENSSPLASTEEDGKETSFPSDVSVAGSEPTTRVLESGSDKSSVSAFVPSSIPPIQATTTPTSSSGGHGKGPKPPTPIATPRCSSPPSNMLGQKVDLTSSNAVPPPVQTQEDITAQEIFLSIAQLTQQAKKDSFDMSRNVQTSIKSVNRETIANVGKSVVDNISTTDWKKLEFLKKLSGSTTPTRSSQSRLQTPPPPPPRPMEPPKKLPLPPALPPREKIPDISTALPAEEPIKPPTARSNAVICDEISQPDPCLSDRSQSLAPVSSSSRPMSPKYDIAFPKSQLGEIASPRPTSRIPKKELMLKKDTPSSSNTAAAVAAAAVTTSGTPKVTPSKAAVKNDETTALTQSKSKEKDSPTASVTTVGSSSRREIETTTSRFLAEHHPQLKRSNSTMSNASVSSSYSQTTQELFNSISSDLSGLATQTSSLLESMFGYGYGMEGATASNNKPATTYVVSGDNNVAIKETVDRVLLGEGIGWLKLNRLKKLMEEEMHRCLMLNYLQRKFGQHLTRDGHIEDLCLGKPVWKGVLRLVTAVIHGLEVCNGATTVSLHSSGLASAFQLLELIHTHYWSPAETMPGISHATSPIVSDSGANGGPNHRLMMLQQTDNESIDSTESSTLGILQDNAFETESETGSIVLDAGMGAAHNHSRSPRRSVLSEGEIEHLNSSSTAVAAGNDNGLYPCHVLSKHLPKKSIWSGSYRFRCGSLHAVIDDDTSSNSSQWMEKSYLFEGLVSVPANAGSNNDNHEQRRRLSGSMAQQASGLWQDMQFWEDLFCDTVAQERQLIGMDSSAEELLQRYKALAENEKRVLENDEDRLLSVILYNLTAFMLLMQVKKSSIRQKIQRLMGKCHLGLVHSVEINQLLDHLDYLEVNDVDLKPLPSRQMCRRTFTVHAGTSASNPLLFMEVREDGLITRSANGVILERWFYDEMVNMTFSPRNKVLCLWRRSAGVTELKKYHTKKCRDLYYCIKDAMESAALRGTVSMPDSRAGTPTSSTGSGRRSSRRDSTLSQLLEPKPGGPKKPLDVGGDYPVEDLATNEGCLLQVCMEGISLLFAKREEFIRLAHIRKCFTQKSSIFVVEEYHAGSKAVMQRKFATKLADQICYSVLCVFSYVAVGQQNRQRAQSKLVKKTRNIRPRSTSSVPSI